MPPFMNAVLLAILLPAAEPNTITAVAEVPNAQECVGRLKTDQLSTSVRTADGVTWIAPWQVLEVAPSPEGGFMVFAVLDRMVRVENDTPVMLAMPQPLAATIETRTIEEAVETAAGLWCASVVNALGPGPHTGLPGLIRT